MHLIFEPFEIKVELVVFFMLFVAYCLHILQATFKGNK